MYSFTSININDFIPSTPMQAVGNVGSALVTWEATHLAQKSMSSWFFEARWLEKSKFVAGPVGIAVTGISAIAQSIEGGGSAGDYAANAVSAITEITVGIAVGIISSSILTPAGGAIAGGVAGGLAGNYVSNVYGSTIKNYVNDFVNQLTNPLILDLNGDGISLISLDKSNVFLDIDKDGFKENTGWVKPDDGILVIDLGMDGQVTSADEFILTNWAPGSTSDLEAARIAFDSNHDGKLDANDTRWSEFKVWQDLNQDGVSDSGEMKTLAELGITEINLTGIPVAADAGTTGPYDNIVSSIAQFTRADGSAGQVGDVGFLYSTYGWRQSADGSGNLEINAEDGSTTRRLAEGPAHVLDLGAWNIPQPRSVRPCRPLYEGARYAA